MVKRDDGRVIPKKNYIYLGLIFILSLMVIFYFNMWYKSYKDSLLKESIIDNYLNVINYNEIDDYIMENKDSLIYVSVLGDEDINKFEVKFVNAITENSLRDIMLYMDVTDIDKDIINSKFGVDYDYPYIVVYTNGKITDWDADSSNTLPDYESTILVSSTGKLPDSVSSGKRVAYGIFFMGVTYCYKVDSIAESFETELKIRAKIESTPVPTVDEIQRKSLCSKSGICK